MLTFDQLLKIPNNVKLRYLHFLVEDHIQHAPGHLHLPLRLTQAKMDRIRKQFKDPMTATRLMVDAMMESLYELRDLLTGSTLQVNQCDD